MTCPLVAPVAARSNGRRLPDWIKVRPPGGDRYQKIKEMKSERGLATVCEEARCPNIGECWSGGTATFMVMGDTCTRGCRFCSVQTAKEPAPLDALEPQKLATTIETMDLDYVVVTSVDRDDIPDQGSHHIAACIEAIQDRCPGTLIEFLIPDFQGRQDLLEVVLDAKPDVLAHNVETVRRLTPTVRDARASYDQSLDVLEHTKAYTADAHGAPMFTKSSLMLGLGETEDEVLEAMADLREVGCDFLTLGQYLRPTQQPRHLEVSRFVPPEQFDRYKEAGEDMGFRYVASGPLVRSSYKAGEFYIKNVIEERREASPA